MRKKKMMNVLLAAALTVTSVSPPVYAASMEEMVRWTTLFGDNGAEKSVLYDSVNDSIVSNGRIITVGVFDGKKLSGEGLKGDRDASISCYDENGAVVWQTLSGGSRQDYFYGVTEGAYGGLVAVGASKSEDGDFPIQNAGNYDAVIAKYDNEGQLVKSVTFGGSDKDEFNAVASTFDGGYVAVGYTRSVDGDLASVVTPNRTREAVIVKFDSELNKEWVATSGGELESSLGVTNELEDVAVDFDGNIIVAGTSTLSNGDMEGLNHGGKDVFVMKYDSTGVRQWVRTYGGSMDDVVTEIMPAHDKNPDLGTGFVLSGTTESMDGCFTGFKTLEAESAFILKINGNGEEEWVNVLESSDAVTGRSVLPTMDGYLLAGTFVMNDLDLTGLPNNGKEDIFIAHYSDDGLFRNVNGVGGNDKDLVEGIYNGPAEDYLLFGSSRSSDQMFAQRKGPVDGFLMSLDKTAVEQYATEKYLAPVVAWKADQDEPSMMAPLLFKEAFVEKTGELYTATCYFVNAQLMGSQVNASSLGKVSYQFDGEMIPAILDEYNATTQVKTVKISTRDISKPVPIHIEDTMGDIRFSFDWSSAVKSDVPPYFPDIEVTQPDFPYEHKWNVGGSDVDYTNGMTVLKDGNLAVVGETYSRDGDFKEHLGGAANGFVNIYTPEGELVHTTLIGSAEFTVVTYLQSIVACDDGGYVVGGAYRQIDPDVQTEASGDLEPLAGGDSVHGKYDSFLARYNKDHERVWIKGFSGSEHDQIKTIIKDQDGFVAIYETMSNDGDMAQLNHGLFDLAVVKYTEDGEKQWQKVLGGRNIESARSGISILQDGNYIVAGTLGSGSGSFEGVDYYGDTFDIFAAKLDRNGEILWVKAYGGNKNEYCYKTLATSDGGFLVGGYTKSTTDDFQETGTSYENPFLMKMDGDGNVQWNDVIKGSEKGEVTDILEFEDEYVVLGETRSNDFDFKEKNKGSKDVFIAHYDKAGNRTYLETIGGSVEDIPVGMVKVNDYQNAVLFYGKSYDGDLKGLNRGEEDGTLIVYNYKDKPVETPTPTPDPETTPTPDPVTPTPDPETTPAPDPVTPTPADPDSGAGQTESDQVKPEKPESVKPDTVTPGPATPGGGRPDPAGPNPAKPSDPGKVNTGDSMETGVWAAVTLVSAAAVIVLRKKRRV